MKITNKTSTELILSKKNGLNPFLFIWSIFFTGIPLIVLISTFSALGVITINCERIEPKLVNCTLNRSGFGGFFPQNKESLNNVIEAQFQQIEEKDSDGATTFDNKVILLSKNGKNLAIQELMFINGVRGNAKEMRQVSQEISNFLNSNESLFVIEIDNRWRWANLFIFCFISIFILIGGTVFMMTILEIGYETIVFDKVSRQLKFEKVNLLGKKKDNISLNEVNGIVLKELTDSDNDRYYLLFISTKNNHEKYQLDRAFQADKLESNGREIANFLDVKLVKKNL